MIFEFGQHKIDVNIEKTRAFYENAKSITAGCTCPGCRNFEKAVDFLDEEIKTVFETMGINMKKACEVYTICENDNENLYYGGFFHLCGTILSGGIVLKDIDETLSVADETSYVFLNKSFEIGFTDEIDLLEENFPVPVIQLEFYTTIPWVLDEKISY